MRSQLKRERQLSWLAGIALLLVLALLGCPGKVLPPEDVAEDARAQKVTIDQNLNADPEHVLLSIAAGDRIQWVNQSSQAVAITIDGDPIGTIVPAGKRSRAERVIPTATLGTYEYRVRALPAGETALWRPVRLGVAPAHADSLPPNEPDFTVGD